MGKMGHSLFLCHLFEFCNLDYGEFVQIIHDRTVKMIRDGYNEVKDGMSGRKAVGNNGGAVTQAFSDFVEEMEIRRECRMSGKGRVPQYCLFAFYYQIATLNNSIMADADRSSDISEADLRIIERFYEAYDFFRAGGAEAVNEKRLRGLVKDIKARKGLNRMQEKVFHFILEECFPYYSDERGGILDKIRSKPWEELAFGRRGGWRDIPESHLMEDGRYGELKDLFERFNPMMAGDSDGIRQNLIEISCRLDSIYQLESGFVVGPATDGQKESLVADVACAEGGRNSEMHSHITAFMHWMPVFSQDGFDEKTMGSVDNIIEKIGLKVCEAIEGDAMLKQSLMAYPPKYSDSFFVRADNIELRKLLIEAIFNEPHIYGLFMRFYGMDDLQTEIKGGIR